MNSCMTCMRFIHWFIVNSFIVKWIQLYEFISAKTWTPHLQHPKVTHCSPYKFTNVHIVRNTQWFWQYLSESPSDSDISRFFPRTLRTKTNDNMHTMTTYTLRTTTCVKMYSSRNETVRCIIDTKLTKRIIAPAHHTTVAKHSTSVVVTSREAFCCRTLALPQRQSNWANIQKVGKPVFILKIFDSSTEFFALNQDSPILMYVAFSRF